MYGEDFLGLRELGIASELGVSSLSVPKKLLRAKGGRMGAGSSLPYVQAALVSSARPLTYPTVPPFALQEQARGTSSTLPTTTSVRPTRVNEDGGRSYWTLTTFLQDTFRCPRTSRSFQTSAPPHGWCYDRRGIFDISTYTPHPRAATSASPPLSNTATTDYATAYTISTTNGAYPSGRFAKPGPNEDGTSRADRWREVNERCREEETEEGERTNVAQHWRRRRRPWCCEWVGRRWNERCHQYERWERWNPSANNDGRISTRECWRDHWGDAGIDDGPGRNIRAGWHTRRAPGGGEEERRAGEGEEGKNVRSCLEGGHCHGVVIITPLSGRVSAEHSISILSHNLTLLSTPTIIMYFCSFQHDRYTRMGLVCICRWRE